MTWRHFLIVSALSVAVTWAQGGGGGGSVALRSVQSSGGNVHMTIGGMQFNSPPVVGAPYSGEEVSEHTQTLSDGTHIAQKFRSQLVYRDSQGRTRTERPVMMGPNSDPAVRIIEIRDPVAEYSYVLDAANKVAHRVKMQDRPRAGAGGSAVGLVGEARARWFNPTTSAPPPPPAIGNPAPPTASPSASRPEFSTESLGAQSIEGVLAEGRRTTNTIPTGAQGNDRPIVSTSETWISQDLKALILSKHTDPRNGETTTKLTNINRAEPDPSLFQPPVDYKLVDEEGQFSIDIARP